MADLVQAVQLTAQMLRMRDAMRSISGEKYPTKIAEWQTAITKVADGKQIDPLQAAIQLAKAADGNSYAVIAVIAAYVEWVEPSGDTPHQGIAA